VPSPVVVWNGGAIKRQLTRFEDCRRALVDPNYSSDPYDAGLASERSHNLLFVSDGRHRTLRHLLDPFFTPQATTQLARSLDMVRDDCLDRLHELGGGDLIAELVEPLVVDATARVLGVPDQVRSPITRGLRGMAGSLEPTTRGRAIASSLIIQRALSYDGDGAVDGFHQRLRRAAAEGRITREEATFNAAVVLHGGYENPLNALGSLVATAAADPAAFHKWAEISPDAVIDETLRLFPPARGVVRFTRPEDSGFGEAVWINLEVANRDPKVFDRPDEPHYDHPTARHLSFGIGPHRCPGTLVARLLAHSMVTALLALPREALAEVVIRPRVGQVTRGVATAEISGLAPP
jgi:cytochrome P450